MKRLLTVLTFCLVAGYAFPTDYYAYNPAWPDEDIVEGHVLNLYVINKPVGIWPSHKANSFQIHFQHSGTPSVTYAYVAGDQEYVCTLLDGEASNFILASLMQAAQAGLKVQLVLKKDGSGFPLRRSIEAVIVLY